MNGFFMLSMMTLLAGYSGALVSFFTVDVHPPAPATMEEVAQHLETEGIGVFCCCESVIGAINRIDSDAARSVCCFGGKSYANVPTALREFL